MHGLLMSLKSWTVTMKEREKKNVIQQVHGAFWGGCGVGASGRPSRNTALAPKCKLSGQRSLGSPPHSPPLPSPFILLSTEAV